MRPGLDYYPRDTDIHANRRIRRLVQEHGPQAFVVYDYLLCQIYSGQGYWMPYDADLAFDIASYLHCGLGEQQVQQIIDACLQAGLLHRQLAHTHHILTSAGIQARYLKAKRLGTIKPEYNCMPPQGEEEEATAAVASNQKAPTGTPGTGKKNGRKKTATGSNPEKPSGAESDINTTETPINATITGINAAEMAINATVSTQSKAEENKEEQNKEEESREEERTANAQGQTAQPPPHPATLLTLDECRKCYLGPAYQHAREQLCISRGLQMAGLQQWVHAFHQELVEEGAQYKTRDDFARHFRNWLKFRNVTTQAATTTTLTHRALPPPPHRSSVPLRSAIDLLAEREKRKSG